MLLTLKHRTGEGAQRLSKCDLVGLIFSEVHVMVMQTGPQKMETQCGIPVSGHVRSSHGYWMYKNQIFGKKSQHVEICSRKELSAGAEEGMVGDPLGVNQPFLP